MVWTTAEFFGPTKIYFPPRDFRMPESSGSQKDSWYKGLLTPRPVTMVCTGMSDGQSQTGTGVVFEASTRAAAEAGGHGATRCCWTRGACRPWLQPERRSQASADAAPPPPMRCRPRTCQRTLCTLQRSAPKLGAELVVAVLLLLQSSAGELFRLQALTRARSEPWFCTRHEGWGRPAADAARVPGTRRN